jgi:hypothetical protein
MAFPPAKRDKLCSKLSQKVVAKVGRELGAGSSRGWQQLSGCIEE